MFLLYILITGLCTYSCLKYAKLESKNQRYRIFDRFHVEAPKHMMSLIEFTEETNDDDSHLYNCMYTDNFYDGYMLDKIDQSTQHDPSLDGTSSLSMFFGRSLILNGCGNVYSEGRLSEAWSPEEYGIAAV